jgi:glycosyltransferase involved in cell wall biosynthesis
VGVIAILPPPFNGMSIATSIILEELQRRGPVNVHRISRGSDAVGGHLWLIRKQLLALVGVGVLPVWKSRGVRTLYLVANSGSGLWSTWLQVRVAKGLGMRVVMHHQVYSYLHRHMRLMQSICALMDARDTHIVLCARMAADLKERYAVASEVVVLPNTITLRTTSAGELGIRSRSDRPRIVGHLSNLSIAKGLPDVLDSFELLASRDPDTELRLAGPFTGAEEQRMVDDAVRRYPGRIHYLGPLRGKEKWEFFAGIDVFLFPTRYANEAYPLVIAEAHLSGVPVIAFDRGCISSQIGVEGGAVVATGADFPAAVAALVDRWSADPSAWSNALEGVRRHGVKLEAAVHAELDTALEVIRRT